MCICGACGLAGPGGRTVGTEGDGHGEIYGPFEFCVVKSFPGDRDGSVMAFYGDIITGSESIEEDNIAVRPM